MAYYILNTILHKTSRLNFRKCATIKSGPAEMNHIYINKYFPKIINYLTNNFW